jgi:CheY-like chemotaxis protein
MDGYETTRKIRSSNKAYSSIPIVAVTANAMSKDNIRCINAGMSDYIKKPINFEVVKQKVERWTQTNHVIANDYSI